MPAQTAEDDLRALAESLGVDPYGALRDLALHRAASGQRCTLCDEFKPLSAFGRDPARPIGLAYRCRACEAARQRARRART